MLNMKFADVGEGLEEGTVIEIFVKEGDTVKEGQDLFSVETDKLTAEIPAPIDGVIAKVLIKADQEIRVGDVVFQINEAGEATSPAIAKTVEPTNDDANVSEPIDEGEGSSVVGSVSSSNEVIKKRVLAPTASSGPLNKDIKSTPIARKMAADLKIDLSSISGTGPNGRILVADIKSHHSQTKISQPSGGSAGLSTIIPPAIKFTGEVEYKPFTKIRQAISKHLTIAKTVIPETTLFKQVNLDALMTMRTQLKPQAAEQNIKLTYMAFFTKAVTFALKTFPIFNTSLDMTSNQLIYRKFYNIGIAVDTPYGLMVPVVKDADKINILEIAEEIQKIATKARNRSLTANDSKDCSFTISNFGSVGIEFGTPVINYPEVAILGVGTIEKKPVVLKDNTIGIASILPLSLTIDHRVIDGADGGRFLMKLKTLLETPALLFF